MNPKKLPLCLAPLLASCAASIVKVEPMDPRVKTIRFTTGSLLDDSSYKSRFERGASAACAGKSYEILERTRYPSTMAGVELESSAFYWVIRCQN